MALSQVESLSLTDWGWNDEWSVRLAESDEGGGQVARVSSRERTLWTIQTEEGAKRARTSSVPLPDGPPAVGDWVVVERGDAREDPWTIVGLLPRRSKFSRRAAGEREVEQVVAANVDRVWIVHGLDLPTNARRLERYLAAAWESGADPELVLTKADIALDRAGAVEAVAAVASNVPVWVVSSKAAPWAGELAETLTIGTTIALLGPSGVGKSSLINYLAGDLRLDEGEVRESDRKGRHTTTRRELVRLRQGALLIDTPGMRELQLWEADRGLDSAFPDIEELAAECRFRDCKHVSEPGCAVREAVASGELGTDRLESYRKLDAELEHRRRQANSR